MSNMKAEEMVNTGLPGKVCPHSDQPIGPLLTKDPCSALVTEGRHRTEVQHHFLSGAQKCSRWAEEPPRAGAAREKCCNVQGQDGPAAAG